MPSEKGDKQAVTIWVDKSLVERIEKLAVKGDITRSQLIVNMLVQTVEYLEKLDKLGIWATARVFRDLGEWLKQRFDKGKVVSNLKSKI